MKIIEVQDLSKKYSITEGSAAIGTLKHYAADLLRPNRQKKDFWAVRNVSFTCNEGDVLGLVGPNGSGKTTLLRIISQVTEPTEGSAWYRGRLGALLGASAGFHPELNSIDNIYLGGSIIGFSMKEIDENIDKIIEFSGLEKFMYEPAKRLSSGMQMRLGLSIVLCLKPEFFIFDEVISVIDQEFRAKIYEYFESNIFGKRFAIVVNHDRSYIDKTCNKIIELENGMIKNVYTKDNSLIMGR